MAVNNLAPKKLAPKKLALVGYGKMGKLIGELAPECGFEVCAIVTSKEVISRESLKGAEAVIEFTAPEAARRNLLLLAECGVPTVCGTTGWLEHLSEIQSAFESAQTALIYGANFSVGVNIFDRVIQEAARLFARQEAYAAWAWEAHHQQKKDAPSGTLLKLKDTMIKAGYSRPIDVTATRAGFIPGTHEIGFDSQVDTITLRHTARNREGFARGALYAAQLLGANKGVFEFSEVLFNEQ